MNIIHTFFIPEFPKDIFMKLAVCGRGFVYSLHVASKVGCLQVENLNSIILRLPHRVKYPACGRPIFLFVVWELQLSLQGKQTWNFLPELWCGFRFNIFSKHSASSGWRYHLPRGSENMLWRKKGQFIHGFYMYHFTFKTSCVFFFFPFIFQFSDILDHTPCSGTWFW